MSSLDRTRSDATNALMQTSRVLVAVVVRSLTAVAPRLTVVQLRVLVMVSGAGALTVNEIAAGLGVNASSASRTCERLVKAGLLQRSERPEDRRHTDVSATKAGHEVVDGVMGRRRSELATLLEGLSEADLDHLLRGLQALNQVAERRDAGSDAAPTAADSPADHETDRTHSGADHHLMGWMA